MGRLSHRMYAETHHAYALWAHTHTHTLPHPVALDREGISTTHTHTVQDQGQLPASIFIIFILPDLLLPSWRQWSQPSPCDASNLHTHTRKHTCSCTLSSPSTDNWDQLLQGASSLDPAPLLHLTLLLHLPFWQKAIPKPPPLPILFLSLSPPPLPHACECVCHFHQC